MRASGLDPDPWQEGLLRSVDEDVLLLCSRQSGKSTTTALLALHGAVSVPQSLILLLSPAQRQSAELYKKVRGAYAAAHVPVKIIQESALQLELENGSRIVSLPGTEQTVRGYSGVKLLVIDEAARVPDELYYAVRPMLAVSRGRLVALSTPFGRDGWFADEWNGDNEWSRIKVTASECPRIDPDFLKAERNTLGEWWYEQEYECVFKDNVDALFSHDAIEAAFDGGVKPLFNAPRPAEAGEPTESVLNPEVRPLFDVD
jgi:hypothetical protein